MLPSSIMRSKILQNYRGACFVVAIYCWAWPARKCGLYIQWDSLLCWQLATGGSFSVRNGALCRFPLSTGNPSIWLASVHGATASELSVSPAVSASHCFLGVFHPQGFYNPSSPSSTCLLSPAWAGIDEDVSFRTESSEVSTPCTVSSCGFLF